MKLNKIISVLMSLVMTATVNVFPVYAEYESGLPELYRTYFKDNTIIDLEYTKTGESDTEYKVIKQNFDYAEIGFTGSDTEFDSEELADFAGCNPDMFSVSYKTDDYNKRKSLTINFTTHEYERNKDISEKLYNVLKEKYEILYAYACLEAHIITENQMVRWNWFEGKDEFGYRVEFKDQFSKKKINEIRNQIEKNDFPVEIDSDDNIIFNETASETDKFRFAFWLEEEYGFRTTRQNIGDSYSNSYNTTEVLHYTDLPGDVNNDNGVTNYDAQLLNEYLLTGNADISNNVIKYSGFNVKNADLTGDGVIDVFDLILLKKQLIESGK
ncbi:MAG: dockerin type I repeat-containing protein [Ruminococcus sp.]|nr:dockerin type I repeat-containing protein [Ruminococcus sp.]